MKNWLYKYFDIEIAQGVTARFRRNRFTGTEWIFQFNCAPEGNVWNSPGYGYGKWTKVSSHGY